MRMDTKMTYPHTFKNTCTLVLTSPFPEQTMRKQFKATLPCCGKKLVLTKC